MNKRVRFLFSGVVQGVGFRPFILRTAVKNGLSGYVQNLPAGVLTEVEGPMADIEHFLTDVKNDLPVLADIANIISSETDPQGTEGFRIIPSDSDGRSDLHIAPDTAVCPDCLKELFDPKDRRYRYPFINCTNCGPRLTIIKDIPYDRPFTAMSCFPMCEDCQAEYDDPGNRRFHAEPNACPQCGPVLSLHDQKGRSVATEDPLRLAVKMIASGHVLAVKGLGGFHLCVDATSDAAVNKLRLRKFREEKPLAIMVRDIDQARTIAAIGEAEKDLLLSHQRPIVLVQKKDSNPLSASIAPGMGNFGIMLPYTPLHHLLMESFKALVMTSGNQVDEPICIGNREAIRRLNGIADYFLVHNRDILVRCDDSIAFVSNNETRMVRRSRGYAPKPIMLAEEYPEVLALGPQLKGSLCLLKGRFAFLSPHIGDLETPQARDFFHENISLMKRITESDPSMIACDLHPGYYATQVAATLSEEVIPVQHHHAHVVSCMAENGIAGDVIGIAMDGTGYGIDGNAWGGEFMLANEKEFRRLGHIKYFILPGGEKAIHEPWRIAVSLIREAFGERWPAIATDLDLIPDKRLIETLDRAMVKRLNSPLSSGLGRVFDGVSALLGLCRNATFEGQAAMALEAVASEEKIEPARFEILMGPDGVRLLDLSETVRAMVAGIESGKSRPSLSHVFHRTLHRAFLKMSEDIRNETGLNRVVLSGGCFQNRILLEGVVGELEAYAFEVFTHKIVPANDGGIALGQAVIAAKRRAKL